MINITIYEPSFKKDAFTKLAEAEYIKRLSRIARIRFQPLAKAPPEALWFDPSGDVLDSPGLASRFTEALRQGNELHLALGSPPAESQGPRCQLISLPLSPGIEDILLMEQIYRAFKILAGEPYHK